MGALTTVGQLKKKLVKCQRLDDNPNLETFTYDQNEVITEKPREFVN